MHRVCKKAHDQQGIEVHDRLGVDDGRNSVQDITCKCSASWSLLGYVLVLPS